MGSNKWSRDLIGCKNCICCFKCIDCVDCICLKNSVDCINCSSSNFLKECKNCECCVRCQNLEDKKYCIDNIQYTKEDFLNKLLNS